MEFAFVINYHVKSLSVRRAEVMFQRHRSIVCIDNIAWLFPQLRYPGSKLARVAYRCRQEDVFNVSRQHDDSLLPDHPSLLVPHVVNLVKNDPLNFSHDLTASVYHISQDLCCHDQTCGILINRYITCYETHIDELVLELSIFLVG